jgi:hypothetical protein
VLIVSKFFSQDLIQKFHMANVCHRPKEEDPPAKSGKDGKDGKGGKGGKGKPKGGKDGKGNPLIKQLGEVPEANGTEKELRKSDSDPRAPEPEQQKELSDLEKKSHQDNEGKT